ncbi:MAG: hypothetical protein Q4D04_08970 [Clostridia bacterium]|nr:hypothetical protein [Clostridia bacterium]
MANEKIRMTDLRELQSDADKSRFSRNRSIAITRKERGDTTARVALVPYLFASVAW